MEYTTKNIKLVINVLKANGYPNSFFEPNTKKRNYQLHNTIKTDNPEKYHIKVADKPSNDN